MRFLVMVKANADTEAGQLPSTEMLTAMGTFNEELVRNGVMQSGEGLLPSSKGARVNFAGASRTVVDGPFTEAKELVAGFWIWQCGSLQEAIDWARKIPNPTGDMGQVEIRQIASLEDFGDNITPAVADQQARIRSGIESNQA